MKWSLPRVRIRPAVARLVLLGALLAVIYYLFVARSSLVKRESKQKSSYRVPESIRQSVDRTLSAGSAEQRPHYLSVGRSDSGSAAAAAEALIDRQAEIDVVNSMASDADILPGGIAQRLVHFDLKGAPPRVAYFDELLPLLRRLGATGLLIEYEDMFPFHDELEPIAARNAYSLGDVEHLLTAARKNGLEVIPLVQTFGHMEYVLKLERFRALRESPLDPSAICPSKAESFSLITAMIDQVMAAHRGVKNLHIGCDEVWHLAEDDDCNRVVEANSYSTSDIFLRHVKRVAAYVRERYGIMPIVWDDMFRQMTPEELSTHRMGDFVEPMVWSYFTEWDRHLTPLDFLYPHVFTNIWAASAFKGSTGETQLMSNASTHALIHTSWLQALQQSAPRYKTVRGIVLTGWQRYTHFSRLCELLPVALPSLALSLQIVKSGGFRARETLLHTAELLECRLDPNAYPFRSVDPPLLSYDPFLSIFAQGKFPGVELFRAVDTLTQWRKQVDTLHQYLLGMDGVVDAFNRRHGYLPHRRLDERRLELDYLQNRRAPIEEDLRTAAALHFDRFVVDEIVQTYHGEAATRLDAIAELYREERRRASASGDSRRAWQARPVNAKDAPPNEGDSRARSPIRKRHVDSPQRVVDDGRDANGIERL